MSRPNPLLWPKPPVTWSYGIAVLSVASALIVSRWPALHLQAARIAASLRRHVECLVGWSGPSLLAIVLSALAFYYYFLPPIYSLAAKPGEIPDLPCS